MPWRAGFPLAREDSITHEESIALAVDKSQPCLLHGVNFLVHGDAIIPSCFGFITDGVAFDADRA